MKLNSPKIRLDQLIVNLGLAESREKAKSLILAGKITGEKGQLLKPGSMVTQDFQLKFKTALPYVSRGGEKLDPALAYFNFDCRNLIALDIGASTGGFTDCLLQKGVKKIYALDVGKNQLHQKLRSDPRVVVKDEINARYLKPQDLPEKVDLITIDVSFISLTLILPKLKPLLKAEGKIIALIKPQFEAGKEKVKKGGIVKDKAVHKEVLTKILSFAEQEGLYPVAIFPTPSLPRKNQEFLLWLETNPLKSASIDEVILRATS